MEKASGEVVKGNRSVAAYFNVPSLIVEGDSVPPMDGWLHMCVGAHGSLGC
jgi:hypothetical protein